MDCSLSLAWTKTGWNNILANFFLAQIVSKCDIKNFMSCQTKQLVTKRLLCSAHINALHMHVNVNCEDIEVGK